MVDAIMTVNEFTLLSMLFNSMGVQPDDGATARFPADVPYRIAVPARERPLTAPRVDPLEGPGLRVGRTFARHPRVAQTRRGNSNYVNRVSPLTPHYRELLILRIGWNCQSVYEWAKHVGSVGRARDHGLEPERIAAGPDAPGWDMVSGADPWPEEDRGLRLGRQALPGRRRRLPARTWGVPRHTRPRAVTQRLRARPKRVPP